MIQLKGQPVSLKIQNEIKQELVLWKEKNRSMPHLVVVLVGEDSASEVYVGHKVKMCEQLGYTSQVIRLPEQSSQAEIIDKIQQLNQDFKVDGLLVQLPLPKHINERKVLESIDPSKDVDCLTQTNIGALVVGNAIVKPCTPAGIIETFKYYNISLTGRKIAVIGRSMIVGTPLVHLLCQENATVTLFHSKSTNLMEEIKNFDIVCVAIGKSEYFKNTDFKKGAVIIDVGIHRGDNHKLTGDIRKESNAEEMDWLSAKSPVPGGVGLTTIALLMKNTLDAAKSRRQLS